MNRHQPKRMINVKRYVQNKRKRSNAIKTDISDLQREKDQLLGITKVLFTQFSEVKEKTQSRSSNNKELADLIKKLNKKIDAIRVILVNEDNKTKAQLQKIKSIDSNLAEFVFETIDELNEMTKESRSLVQELQKKNNQNANLFPSLFDIHNIPQESKPSLTKLGRFTQVMERNRFSAQQHLDPLGVNSSSNELNAKLFGPPLKSFEPDAYDKQSYSHYALPELFRDKTRLLKDSIDGFIIDSPEENFYTQILLPWQQSPTLTVEWNEWIFDGGVAEQVPHEGVSRLLTSQKSKHKKTIVRRGIGFKMEADYFGTPEGQEAYSRNIKGIANTVKETQDHDTIVQLFLARTYEKLWHSRYKTTESIPLEKIFEEEIENYGSLTFDKNRLHILYEHSKRFMARDGVRGPFVLIMTPGSQIYMTMVGKDTEYFIGGPEGIKQLKRGPKALAVFRDGTRIFETRDFNVNFNSPPVQPAQRRMAIAEFYQMYMNVWRYEDLSKGFKTKHRDTILYDETRDSWQRVHFLDAFINSRLFGEGGKYARTLVEHVRKFTNESHMEIDGEHGKPTPHFLSAPDNNGKHFLIDYFGQMTANRENFIQMGQTLMGSILDGDTQDHLDTWDDMLRLIDDIESQPYDHDYWLELIRINEQSSINQTGDFIGQRTPDGALKEWGEKRTLREWTPNTSGSLNLPDGNKLNGVDYPAGFANFPGFLTLAREAGKEGSYWQKLGKRAKKVTELIHKIVDRCKRIVPTSAVINPKHQSLWFHRKDAGTVFVENIVGVRRPPLWISALAPIKENGQVKGGAFGEKGSESKDVISWHKRPRIPLVVKQGSDLSEIEDLAREIRKGEFGIKQGDYTFTSPITGTEVSIPYAQLAYSALLPKELVLLMLMGTKSSVSLMEIFEAIDKVRYFGATEVKIQAKKDMINMTLSTLFGYAVSKKNRAQLRALVRGIAQDASTPETLIKTINAIHIGPGANADDIKKSRAMITKLVKIGNVKTNDEDIPVFKDLERLYPPVIRKLLNGEFDSPEVTEPGGISIKALEPDFERIRDVILELNLIRRELNLGPVSFNGTLPALEKIDATAGTALQSRHDALIDQYNLLGGKIRDALKGVDDNFANSLRREAVKRVDGRKFSVVDDAGAAMRSRFYRSPLTMSLDLLESLSRAGQSAFIRPSDPTTGHTTFFYELQNNDNDDEIETTLPGELWKRPEFARVSDFLDSKHLEHITFIAKEIKTPTVSSEFDDDDDSDDDDFSKRKNPWKIKSDSKRRRIEAGRFQEKVSFPDDSSSDDESDGMEDVFGGFRNPQGGWNKKTLREPGSGVDVRRPFANLIYSDKYNKIVTDTFVNNYSESNNISDPLLRAMVQILLFTKSEGNQWIRMIKNDVLVPINILLWRPTIAHNMDSFILMKPGLETGANLYRNSNFSTGNDIASKILIGNYTFYSKAIIWEPKNITILENVKPSGYCGGNNVEFMGFTRDLITQSNNKYRPSLIATAVPLSEADPMRFMDLTGPTFINPGDMTYSTAEYYSHLWGITNVDNHMDGRYSFFHKSKRINYTALQGHQFLFNNTTGTMDRIVEAQGHRKKMGSYPGAASIWNGVDKHHKKYDFGSVKLE